MFNNLYEKYYPTYWRRQLKNLLHGRGFCRTCLRYPFACPNFHWSKKERAEFLEKVAHEEPLYIRGENGELIRNPARKAGTDDLSDL